MWILECRIACWFSVFAMVLLLCGVEGERCDSEGNCNYGGKCENGNCSCAFQCMNTFTTEKYCRYNQPDQKPGTRRPHFYRNLCQVLSHACNLQMDVPIVKATGSRRSIIQACVNKQSEFRLCPNVTNYQGGRCGVSERYKLFNAGVCQMRISTNVTECKCPRGQTGNNCQSKYIMSMHGNGDDDHVDDVPVLRLIQPHTNEPNTAAISPIAIILYGCIALLLLLFLFILLTYRKFCHLPSLLSNQPPPCREELQLRNITTMIMNSLNNETKMLVITMNDEGGKDAAIKVPSPSEEGIKPYKSNLCARI